jgi:hypothetical protein
MSSQRHTAIAVAPIAVKGVGTVLYCTVLYCICVGPKGVTVTVPRHRESITWQGDVLLRISYFAFRHM